MSSNCEGLLGLATAVGRYSCCQSAGELIPRSNLSSLATERMKDAVVQGDPYGRGIVYVDSKYEVAFSCKVGLLSRPVTEL